MRRTSAAMSARFWGMAPTVGSGALSGSLGMHFPRLGRNHRRASTFAMWRRVVVSSDRISASIWGAAAICMMGYCGLGSAALSLLDWVCLLIRVGTMLRPREMLSVPARTTLRSSRMLVRCSGATTRDSITAFASSPCHHSETRVSKMAYSLHIATTYSTNTADALEGDMPI